MEERKHEVRRPELRVLYLDKNPRIVRVIEDLSDEEFERSKLRIRYDGRDYDAIYEVKKGELEGVLKNLEGVVIENIYGLVGERKLKKKKK